MITLSRMRELVPSLKESSDEEVALIRDELYGLTELALESYFDECVSKIPVGLTVVDDEK